MSAAPDPASRFWFGAYVVPPDDGPAGRLARLGSALLGRDVRADAPVPDDAPGRAEVRAALGAAPDAWTASARPFGFHLTVGEALRAAPGVALDDVAADVQALLDGLDPASELRLEPSGLESWDGGRTRVLRYAPSRPLELLQAALLPTLAGRADRSLFDDALEAGPDRWEEPHLRARLRAFRTPRGYDAWRPHFTLLDPVPELDPAREAELRAGLERLFGDAPPLEVRSLALCVRGPDGGWRVARDIARV